MVVSKKVEEEMEEVINDVVDAHYKMRVKKRQIPTESKNIRDPDNILMDLEAKHMERSTRIMLNRDKGKPWEELINDERDLKAELEITLIYCDLREKDPDTSQEELLELATMQHKLGIRVKEINTIGVKP